MGRISDNLTNAKAKVAYYEYELSDEVKAKKLDASKEIYNLLKNQNGTINIEGSGISIDGEYYDKYLDYYNPNATFELIAVFAYDEDGAFVEDEDKNEHFFIEDLTLSEVENILREVKDRLEE